MALRIITMTWVSANSVRNFWTGLAANKFKWRFQNGAVAPISASNTTTKDIFFDKFKIHYWPTVMCVWFSLSLIITYSISVSKKHTYKFFPYISDTGTYSPESCIFGQTVNLGSFFMALNMYLRYRQVDIINQLQEVDCSKSNRTSMWMAIIGCLGMSVVANFQKTNMRNVHFIGSDMVLGSGVLYTMFQAKVSYAFREMVKRTPSFGMTHTKIVVRMIISVINIILFFILVGCGYASEKEYRGDLIWWTPEDAGYIPHVVAAIAEWLIIILFCIFVCTFTDEFRVLEYKGIEFKIRQ